MNLILLSGGSGKRLWPLSNESRSKQFLKLLKNDRGEYESMLQRVFRQMKQAGLSGNIVVTTSRKQVDMIRSQAGGAADIVLEPERRDTCPAVLLACAYLYYEKHVDLSEPVVVLPVDPYAEQEYFNLLPRLAEQAYLGTAEIALMGAIPTYPSEKYGYLVPGAPPGEGGFFPVRAFYEKPDLEKAEQLVREGALWNCGVFAFTLGYMLRFAANRLPFHSFNDMVQNYGGLEKISFDYAVLEKAKSICAIRYGGEWCDLGTWNTLTDQMPDDTVGMVVTDRTTRGTHVINELDVPVVVMGARNMVIVASRDGILVADKQESSYLKPLAEQVANRPMYEERRWGEYSIIDRTGGSAQRSLTRHIHLQKGKSTSYQMHRRRQEVWIIIEGAGDLVMDGEKRRVTRGDVVQIPEGTKHQVIAVTDLHIIEVQIGINLEEMDVEHF